MTQKKKKEPAYCSYRLSENYMRSNGYMRGLRGKRRKAFQVALTRAQTLAAENYATVKNDPRTKKLKAIEDAYSRKCGRARDVAVNAAHKLYPNINTYTKSEAFPAYTLELDAPIMHFLVYDYESTLLNQLRNFAAALREAPTSTTSPRKLNPCGSAVPTGDDLKAIAKDPTLKSALDDFTKHLGEESKEEK